MIKVKSEFLVHNYPEHSAALGEERFKEIYNREVERMKRGTAEEMGVLLAGLTGGHQKVFPLSTDPEFTDRYKLTVLVTTPEKWNLFQNKLCHAMNKFGADAEAVARELFRQFTLSEEGVK